MIKVKTTGSWKKTESFLDRIQKNNPMTVLNKLGQLGVDVLVTATPKDSGLTASSWYYEIEKTREGYNIQWLNSNVVDNYNVALLLQYGHGTNGGGYVVGIDYINPVMDDLLKAAKIDIWKEVAG